MRSNGKTLLTKKRVLIVVLVIVVLVAGGTTAFLATRTSTSKAKYTLSAATLGTIKQSVSSTGTIEPANESSVNFTVSGQVTAVDVSVGQTVTAGQTLATVDTTALQASVSEAQATLDSDEARLSSDDTAKASSTQITADNAAVTAAQQQLAAAQESLTDATLTSPIAGTIASMSIAVGQQVSAGSSADSTGSTGSGSSGSSAASSGFGSSSSSDSSSSSSSSSDAQFLVIGTGSYIVNATVDDTEVGEITDGDQVTVTPSGATTPVYGTVASVGLLATSTSGVASFPMVVDITGSPTGLYAGTSADLTVVTKVLSNVIEVPTAALKFSTGGETVTVLKGGQASKVSVTTGEAYDGETQITQGITSGEEVEVPVVTLSGGRTFTRGSGTGASGFGGFGGGGGFGGFGGGGLGGAG